MKSVLLCSVCGAVILAASIAFAVSPRPAEIDKDLSRKQFSSMQHETDMVCNIRVTHIHGSSGIPIKDDLAYTFYFDSRMPKKDAIEKVLELSKENLSESSIASVSIDCSFHNQMEVD